MEYAPIDAEEQAVLQKMKERRAARERENYQKLLNAHRRLREAEERAKAEGSQDSPSRHHRHKHGHGHHRSKGSRSHRDGDPESSKTSEVDKGKRAGHSGEPSPRHSRASGQSTTRSDEHHGSQPSSSAVAPMSSISRPSMRSSHSRALEDATAEVPPNTVEAREGPGRDATHRRGHGHHRRRPSPSHEGSYRQVSQSRPHKQSSKSIPEGSGAAGHNDEHLPGRSRASGDSSLGKCHDTSRPSTSSCDVSRPSTSSRDVSRPSTSSRDVCRPSATTVAPLSSISRPGIASSPSRTAETASQIITPTVEAGKERPRAGAAYDRDDHAYVHQRNRPSLALRGGDHALRGSDHALRGSDHALRGSEHPLRDSNQPPSKAPVAVGRSRPSLPLKDSDQQSSRTTASDARRPRASGPSSTVAPSSMVGEEHDRDASLPSTFASLPSITTSTHARRPRAPFSSFEAVPSSTLSVKEHRDAFLPPASSSLPSASASPPLTSAAARPSSKSRPSIKSAKSDLADAILEEVTPAVGRLSSVSHPSTGESSPSRVSRSSAEHRASGASEYRVSGASQYRVSTDASDYRISTDASEELPPTLEEAREELERELQKPWIHRKPRTSRLDAALSRYAARLDAQSARSMAARSMAQSERGSLGERGRSSSSLRAYPSGFGRQVYARSCATLLEETSRPSNDGLMSLMVPLQRHYSISDFVDPPDPNEKPTFTKLIKDRMRSLASLKLSKKDKWF